MNPNIPQVSLEENDIVTFKLTMEEVRRATFKMKLQMLQIVMVIKLQFIRLFGLSSRMVLSLFLRSFLMKRYRYVGLNFVVVTLLTSGHEATMIQRYRPTYIFRMLFSLK
jgi:hypothetical protein